MRYYFAAAYARRAELEAYAAELKFGPFTGEGTRGGRHIEHGIAIGYHDNHPWDLSARTEPIRLIVVGPREHVFHCHPATEVYPDWQAFLKHERATS